MKKYPEAAKEAVLKELTQLVEMGTFTPQKQNELPPAAVRAAIRCFIFLKEKFFSDGRFEKLKARLVAGGHMQDMSLYHDDLSSPTASTTASTTAILICLCIAAREERHVVTIDVPGAYLHADLKPDAPHPLMIIDADTAAVLCEIKPEWSEYRRKDGSIIVRLNKGLYGLVESAKLWNEHIISTLAKLGFKPNPLDPCTLNVEVRGVQCTINIHVDDLLITCKDKSIIKKVKDLITETYGGCTMHEGTRLSYLGLTLDFSRKGCVEISMQGFIEDWMSGTEVTRTAASPAASDLFVIDDESPPLSEELRKNFHSQVAKALYAAKRARPDLATAVSFLSTRVTKATYQDMAKLERLLKYVNGTRGQTLTLRMSGKKMLVDYIDASYGVHADFKSHGASCITLGWGFFYVKSSKLKLMTKSSTEAELVAVSDHYSQAVWCAKFLEFQGHDFGPAIIAQDNQSTMTLLQKGRSTSDRTRHIDIRYFFVKEKVDSGAVKIVYCNTKQMVADILTKPLQGEQFRTLRDILMGKTISPIYAQDQ
jgi:hypothetical protein